MALAQRTVGNTVYYTDGVNYYTFHTVNSTADTLWMFASLDLGISKRSGFSTEEAARIHDLAGSGLAQKTKYRLLKDGQAVDVPYHNTGSANLRPGDVILRQVPPPGVGLVKCPHCASSVLPGPVCSVCGKQLTP